MRSCLKRRNPAPAFTLVELMSVLAIIGTLSGLLLPAIQHAREASRRSKCQSNLHQIGLALENFEGRRGHYPVGTRSQVTWPSGMLSFGVSWWTDILPDLDEAALAARLDVTGANAGWMVLHPLNGRLIDNVFISTIFCPSSSIIPFSSVGGFRVEMPSYVGVSGAANGDGFVETRVSKCCVPLNDGELAAGGVLIPNQAIRRSKVTDGTSHTLLVGETSEYCFDTHGISRRVDGGFPNGWIMGTSASGVPPDYDPRMPGAYNVTTVQHPINTRDYDLPGIHDDHGANNPFLSAHPGGAVLLFADGSVHFMSQDTEIQALKRLATRDDGQDSQY